MGLTKDDAERAERLMMTLASEFAAYKAHGERIGVMIETMGGIFGVEIPAHQAVNL